MPAKRRIALRSQRMPNSSSNMPTTQVEALGDLLLEQDQRRAKDERRSPSSAASPPTTPNNGARQPRVLPTATTMVNASAHSTRLARNDGVAAIASVRYICRSGYPVERPRIVEAAQDIAL